MRIAYLTGEYLRPTHTFIQREVAVLRSYGVEIDTFSIRRTDAADLVSPEQQAERDRTTYILPPSLLGLLKSHITLLLRSPQRYFQGLRLALKGRSPGLKALFYQLFYFIEAGLLAQELKKRQIQHLHNHFSDSSCTVAMLAAMLAGLPFSFTIHGPYLFFEPYRWRLDLKIQEARFVICISHYCRSQAMFFSPMAQWDKLKIVHCGVDPHRYPVITHRPNSKQILYIGRLSAAKGVPILLQALAKVVVTHPDATLTIVGDGPDRQTLETLARELEITSYLKFVGYQSQDAVCNYLQNSDVFILPSFAEGLPVVLMEALATGVPVIATAIAAVSELVENGLNGYVVPPGAVEPLAQRLDELLRNPELRQRFGLAGRQRVEQEFNLYTEVARLRDILSATLNELPDSISSAINKA
jgi:colanic acid/amylovoran biosynthesis glycosyltransferase